MAVRHRCIRCGYRRSHKSSDASLQQAVQQKLGAMSAVLGTKVAVVLAFVHCPTVSPIFSLGSQRIARSRESVPAAHHTYSGCARCI